MDLIEFPDPVELAGAYLQAALTDLGDTARVGSAPVAAQSGPGVRPGYIRLIAGGGSGSGIFIADASLIVEAYADSAAAAYRLASRARAVLHVMAASRGTGVHRILSAGLPLEMDHPSGLTRFTFTLTLRLTALPASRS